MGTAKRSPWDHQPSEASSSIVATEAGFGAGDQKLKDDCVGESSVVVDLKFDHQLSLLIDNPTGLLP